MSDNPHDQHDFVRAQRAVHTRCRRLKLLGTILALTTVWGADSIHATGFFINQQSVRGLGRADAGNAAAALDPSTVFFNPAGMTELWRRTDTTNNTLSEAGISVIVPRSRVTNTGSTAITPGSGGVAVYYPGANATDPGNVSPVPQSYLVHRLGKAYIGLGVNSPFGLSGEYDNGWFGRYDSLKSKLQTINISPVVAVPLSSSLSIGGGVDVQYERSEISLALPNPLNPGGPTPATDGLFRVKGDSWAVGFNVGVLYKPIPALRLGIHYRSQMRHELEGTATTSFPGALATLNSTTKANATSELPDIVTAGIAYEATPSLTLFGDFSWYHWGLLGDARIRFADGSPDAVFANGYRDTYAVAVGASYRWNERLTLRGGFRFDRTPTEDQFRNTSFADANRYWLTAGASYTLSDAWSVDLAVAHVLEDSTQIDITRTFYTGTPLASSVHIRADVESSVTTFAAAAVYRF